MNYLLIFLTFIIIFSCNKEDKEDLKPREEYVLGKPPQRLKNIDATQRNIAQEICNAITSKTTNIDADPSTYSEIDYLHQVTSENCSGFRQDGNVNVDLNYNESTGLTTYVGNSTSFNKNFSDVINVKSPYLNKLCTNPDLFTTDLAVPNQDEVGGKIYQYAFNALNTTTYQIGIGVAELRSGKYITSYENVYTVYLTYSNGGVDFRGFLRNRLYRRFCLD